jgi:hypothetical protein
MRTISKWHNTPNLQPQNFNDFIMHFSDSVPALKMSSTLSQWKRIRELPWAHVVETMNNFERELGEFLIEYDAAIDMIRVGIQETDVFIREILGIIKTFNVQAQEILSELRSRTP